MYQLWHMSRVQEWQQTGRKGIWLKVPISHAQLVPVATQHGFYFHHAEPEYVMLARWLPDTENKLPSNASHQVHTLVCHVRCCPNQHIPATCCNLAASCNPILLVQKYLRWVAGRRGRICV